MAFKLKGFNPGKGTGMGSAFTKKPNKTYQKRQSIQSQMYKEGDDPNEPTKYSQTEKTAGAGSSEEFFKREQGDTKKKTVVKKGYKQGKTTGGEKTGEVVTTKRGKNTLYLDKETKRDKKGKAKRKRTKDTAKKSITNKKRTIQIDSYGTRNRKQEQASKQAEKEGKDPSLAANPYKDVGDAQFTGKRKDKKAHKSGDRKATITTRGKNEGLVVEKERRKSGIGYRKTGRSYVDEAYVESQKKDRASAVADKQKKKDDKAKAKADKPTFKEKRADVKEQHRQKDLAEAERTRQKIQERKERKGKA